MADEGEANAPPGDPMVPAVARIRRRRREARNVWTIELEPDVDRPAIAPGQFNMLYVLGVGEIPISMSGDPAKDAVVHTVRGVGAVSDALTNLKQGDALGLRGPYGTPWPLEDAAGKDIIVMAGGIGLAPLRPILYRTLSRSGDYGRISLLYGTRSPEDILYGRELERWRKSGRAVVETTVDHATADWTGPVGVVTSLLRPDLFDPDNAVAFLCGPEVMMRFSVGALMDLGLPPAAIYLSMERNMKCAVGHCGHCQYGPAFVCKDGPVFRYDTVRDIFAIREI